MNKVILAGRLARDPEVRYTQSGKAVASFSLAVNRRFSRSAQDDGQPTADFIPVVAWDKLAEICGNHLVKGAQICLEGRMQVRTYDGQDGQKRYVTEVVANEIEFMGSRPEGAGQGNTYQRPAAAPTGQSAFGPDIPDEDIPF